MYLISKIFSFNPQINCGPTGHLNIPITNPISSRALKPMYKGKNMTFQYQSPQTFFKVGVLKNLQNHRETAVLESFLNTFIFFKETRTQVIYETFKNTSSGCFCVLITKLILNHRRHTILFHRRYHVIRCRTRRPGRLLNVLCTFSLCPVSTGDLIAWDF